MKSTLPQIILASASARRKKLLEEINLSFITVIPDVDESDCPLSVRDTVISNALLKNARVSEDHPSSTVISADTDIEFKGRLVGKPADMDEARSQLRSFSGTTHFVYTGLACRFPKSPVYSDACGSEVKFRNLSESMIDEYLRLVNPLDKAGSYDIGSHGDIIIESYTGSLTNIIGLPMELLMAFLQKHGYSK